MCEPKNKIEGEVMRQASAILQMRFVQALAWTLVLAVAMGLNTGQASANPRYAAYVLDTNTGQVLFSRNADQQRFPASLTKIMTLYLVFEAMDAGRINKNTKIPISAKAAAESPSKIGVRAGTSITVEQAILALVTKSANDAATATGEFLGGSEANFARMMTNKARQLGMNSTTFRNAHGLPNNQQVTTARDMAILGLAIREHFPEHYAYFNTRQFNFGKQRFGNHNRLLGRVTGVDGIKTGYIRASGFNLVTSVRTGGRSLVAVVMGGQSGASRDAHMADLIREHLPRASKQRSNPMLVARTPVTQGTAARTATAFALPERVQAPAFRPAIPVDAPAQPQMAYAPSQPVRASAASVPAPAATKTEVLSAATQTGYAPAPERFAPPMPVASLDTAEESGSVDPMPTASTAPSSGWAVQVASVGSQSEAMQVLGRIKDNAGPVLASAQPFTVPFTRNGVNYVRARFGFTSKDDAWNACNALKRQKIDCFAEQM
jgi:D-alanyl-D-alanine carboxypeptidase